MRANAQVPRRRRPWPRTREGTNIRDGGQQRRDGGQPCHGHNELHPKAQASPGLESIPCPAWLIRLASLPSALSLLSLPAHGKLRVMIADNRNIFRPHPLLRGGHAQTLAGVYLPAERFAYRARQHVATLPDGDRIVLHDDCPDGWQAGNRVALLIHGLSGCHQSGYMVRVAARLEEQGVRTFRMDLRGCGAGVGLARQPYHSGRSEDAAAALEKIAEICPGSPAALVGFSLGGNIALKLLGELGDARCGHLDTAVAICPPFDLQPAVEQLHRYWNRLYERYFVRRLVGQVRERQRAIPDLPAVEMRRMPQSLFEFDDVFTAPVCGFGRAVNYYRQASAVRVCDGIRLPALVIAAQDDPLVPAAPLERLRSCPSVELEIARDGGHLGFVGWREGNRRWLDGRIVDWVTSQSFDLAQPCIAASVP